MRLQTHPLDIRLEVTHAFARPAGQKGRLLAPSETRLSHRRMQLPLTERLSDAPSAVERVYMLHLFMQPSFGWASD